MAFAKDNPAKLNVGTIAVGSTQHLAAKLFETLAGITAPVVPYKASTGVLAALRAGEIDMGALGMRVAASTPAEQGALLAGEIKRWGDLIRAAKIEME